MLVRGPKRLGPPSVQRVRRWIAQLPDEYTFDTPQGSVAESCPVAQVARLIHPEYRSMVGIIRFGTMPDEPTIYCVRYDGDHGRVDQFPMNEGLNAIASTFDKTASNGKGKWHAITAAELRRVLHIRKRV